MRNPYHSAQFFNTDEFLCEVAADFIILGLNSDEPVAAIVTSAHRQAITERLLEAGFSPSALQACVRWMDANEALDRFMDGAIPNAERFKEIAGTEIRLAGNGNEHQRVRVFGEMVDVLCKADNLAGALRLEQLWNDLAETQGFLLLCAYAAGNIYRESARGYVEKICGEHGRVLSKPGGTGE